MKYIFVFSLFLIHFLVVSSKKQVYIVYFGGHKGDRASHEIEEMHHSYLLLVKETEEEARNSLIYSYKNSINGFAAVLSSEEALQLSEFEEVVSVFESHPRNSLQTTRSWKFLGLDGLEEDEEVHVGDQFNIGRDILLSAKYGMDIVVGVIDTGIWPESKSFNEENMDPIPKSWNGICQDGVDFNSSHCNRKIIGARYYLKNFEVHYGSLNFSEDIKSARDVNGHGTHIASIVAGRRIRGAAALGGFAEGTASGGAPNARLAIYKVCWVEPGRSKINSLDCLTADIVAAIDDAIGDGVHVLSISIVGSKSNHYHQDGIAIAELHALKNNIVVVCSAGNGGPKLSTVSNVAPWVITVGSSSIDRKFIRPLVLDNGIQFMGQTATSFELNNMHKLVRAVDVENPSVEDAAKGKCTYGSLPLGKIKGHIVLCDNGQGRRTEKGIEVKRVGGAGFILRNNEELGNEVEVENHVLPAITLTASDAMNVSNYINSTKNPMATIGDAMTIIVKNEPAPLVCSFSGRGPSLNDPFILKPDIVAPGLNILGAWSEDSTPTMEPHDSRQVEYNILTGSSMATPHVAAVVALVKAIHPSWSSAAIRSAVLTTASTRDNMGSLITDYDGKIATPFALGFGQLNPTKAVDPGLVFDASYTDYLIYLCNNDLKTIDKIRSFDQIFECPEERTPVYNLNYPSLAIPQLKDNITIKRTVTNVGNSNSDYVISIKKPTGLLVNINPKTLSFDHVGQKKSFEITMIPNGYAKKYLKNSYRFGSYTWTNKDHTVTSPIVVSFA
ncbi:subtilisin-like protease SBT5.6 [Tripterygium wilfordii]|uniref:subtilisin-like protease SBT5.6 n=1 Tax=Tripterygium wilfordii TaxID=458696 RepID=UPI0018F81502|nr:subtilisin-like protease SBT5.6 [Tripterygium wilfordii]